MKKKDVAVDPDRVGPSFPRKQVLDVKRIRREFDEQGEAAKRLLEAVEQIWADDGPAPTPAGKEDAAK